MPQLTVVGIKLLGLLSFIYQNTLAYRLSTCLVFFIQLFRKMSLLLGFPCLYEVQKSMKLYF